MLEPNYFVGILRSKIPTPPHRIISTASSAFLELALLIFLSLDQRHKINILLVVWSRDIYNGEVFFFLQNCQNMRHATDSIVVALSTLGDVITDI